MIDCFGLSLRACGAVGAGLCSLFSHGRSSCGSENVSASTGEGVVTLTKNGPNLLVNHEAKPLKMNISTIGRHLDFAANPINVTMPTRAFDHWTQWSGAVAHADTEKADDGARRSQAVGRVGS